MHVGGSRNAVRNEGTSLHHGVKGSVPGSLGAAARYEQDVVSGQRDIGHFAGQDGFQVDGNLGPVVGAGHDAPNFGVLGSGGFLDAFREGENLQGAEAAVLAQDVGAGFFYVPNHVDGIGFGDGDDVMRLDEDVLRGIRCLHHAFDFDGCDGELAGRIIGGATQWDGSPFDAASDVDDIAGFRAEAASEGENFEEILLTLKLMDSGRLDFPQDRNGLAAHFGQVNRDVGSDEIFLQPRRDGGFELLCGQAAGLNTAYQKEIDVPLHVDGNGFVVNFLDFRNADENMVAGPERVGVGRRDGWGRLKEQEQSGKERDCDGAHL